MYDAVEAVLNEHVRPLLQGHGGDMRVIEVANGVVRFKLTGRCAGCAAADLTTEALIQSELVQRVPGITQAILVQDTNPALMEQARSILRQRHGG